MVMPLKGIVQLAGRVTLLLSPTWDCPLLLSLTRKKPMKWDRLISVFLVSFIFNCKFPFMAAKKTYPENFSDSLNIIRIFSLVLKGKRV